jgi:hypothetical protein
MIAMKLKRKPLDKGIRTPLTPSVLSSAAETIANRALTRSAAEIPSVVGMGVGGAMIFTCTVL